MESVSSPSAKSGRGKQSNGPECSKKSISDGEESNGPKSCKKSSSDGEGRKDGQDSEKQSKSTSTTGGGDKQQQTKELTEKELAPIYEKMISKYLKGKEEGKDQIYKSVPKFLNSPESNPLCITQKKSFYNKTKDVKNFGHLPQKKKNCHRETKHRHNQDLLAKDIRKWMNEKEDDNGKMTTVIYSSKFFFLLTISDYLL